MELKAFLEDLLTKHAGPVPRLGPPLVLFDECVDLPTVVPVVREGIRRNTVFASRPLWTQLRRKADGTLFHLEGRAPRRGPGAGDWDWGTRESGYSVSDRDALLAAIANFLAADRLVILSANVRLDLKRDSQGLRALLMTEIAPVLQRHHQRRFGMLALMKGPRIGWSTFAGALAARLAGSAAVSVGFEYHVVRK